MKMIFFAFTLLLSLNLTAQQSPYSRILDHITDKNFFEAKKLYEQHENELSEFQKNFTEAYISNAFNDLNESQSRIKKLLKDYPTKLSRKNIADLYNLQHENALKLYDYKLAKKSIEIILNEFKDVISEEEAEDFKNSLNISNALEKVSEQTVSLDGNLDILMTKDKVGLNTLPVSTKNHSAHFIFDTGANLSTTIHSVAKKMGMKFLKGDIKVGTITGKTVNAQLAVCKEMKIDKLTLKNVVFLVFEDEDLAFSQIEYQIYGILGYPVMEALREIQITQDGHFIVTASQSEYIGESNLAMDNLQPIILLDGKHFSFDTGATKSMLYYKYFKENKLHLEENYPKSQTQFGGAGGSQSFESYNINFSMKVNDKELTLNQIDVLTADTEKKWKQFYGNLGQDLISQFDKMTINFDRMFIKFD